MLNCSVDMVAVSGIYFLWCHCPKGSGLVTFKVKDKWGCVYDDSNSMDHAIRLLERRGGEQAVYLC